MSTLDAFLDWKSNAHAGQRFCYHVGLLPRDLSDANLDGGDLISLNNCVIDMYLGGHFELAQCRNEVKSFDYFIIKRAVPDTATRWWKRHDGDLIRGDVHRVNRRRVAA